MESRAPGLVRAADAAAVLFLLLALCVLVLGGFVLHLGPIPVRVHDPGRLLVFAVAIAALRHVVYRRHPLPARVLRGLRNRGPESAQTIARAAVASRVAILIVGYFAIVTVGLYDKGVGYMSSDDPAANLPARFDASWYAEIALDGYSFTRGRFDLQQNAAFFPAYPMLERAIGYPLGAFAPALTHERRMTRLLWSGVLLSLIAFAWAAVYLWRLARDTIGEAHAADAVALLAAYPFAVYFSAAYTESLFLLAAVAAMYHYRRQEFVSAALWGLLVGLTRPNGCFLSLVLVCLTPAVLRSVRAWIAAAAPGAGMLAYSAFVKHLTGEWFGWAHLHEAWGRSYEGLAPVHRAIGWITDEGLLHVVRNVPFDTLNSVALIFVLLMLWSVFRRLGAAYVLFVLINVIPPMLAGGVLSMGRITATVFPVFFALAASASPRTVTTLITAFAIGEGLIAVLFFTWRPMF
jgi:hypothetical protein